tara:strand:- start:2130 stop:2531 length:402 start_codon:yes stop_codon:yes gene_type:complete
MAKAKVNSTKGTKVTVNKVEVVKEEVVVPQPTITGYLSPVFVLREPADKNIPVADIFYKKNSDAITLQCHAPNHEASLEQIIQGDISIQTGGNINMISKSESPEAWIKNLNKSREFSGHPFITGEAQPLYEAE